MDGASFALEEPVAGGSGIQPKTASLTVKVWNGTKTKGKVLTAKTFEDLVVKIRQKFEVNTYDTITVVCEDSCEIDDDEGLWGMSVKQLPSIFFLVGNEQLASPLVPDSSEQSKYQFLMENMKRKRGLGSETRQKKERLTVKLLFGWMHYKLNEKRFIAVRSQKGGGTKSEEVMRSSTYAQIMDKLLQHFFPGGKSMMGKISKLNVHIGDGRGNTILKDNFSLETIGKDNRLNIMTKENVFVLDSDSDSDFELPHLQFRNVTVIFNPDSLKCCVCYERERKAFLIPCGHQYCMECAVQLNSTSALCALCRAGISGVGKLQYT